VRNDTRNPIRRLDEAIKPLTDPAPLAMVMRFDDSVAVLNLRVRARTEHF
jgi:small conductance mechanosensitive channel